jgi:lipid-A-disaccharide synthase
MTVASKGAFNSQGFKKIIIVAGEASGDLHGSNLVRSMKALYPRLSIMGIGGNRLKEAGVELIANCSEMGVVGLTEVGSKLRQILGVLFRLKSIIRESKPDLVILIDYPDFNIPLAKSAKKAGVPVLYYISPQVWAWRKNRIRTLKKVVTKMAVILPFEPAVYKEFGMDVDFVGHPLLDIINDDITASPRNVNGFRIGMLPGSREGEIRTILPVMLESAEILSRKIPGPLSFFLPLAETIDQELIRGFLEKRNLNVEIVREDIYAQIKAADAVMVASGTATLETALLGTPMVVLYRVSSLTYFAGKCLINVKCISLVNIIAGRIIVPELIQDDMNPQRIADEVAAILEDPHRAEQIRAELKEVKTKLGGPGASERAARIACGLLN